MKGQLTKNFLILTKRVPSMEVAGAHGADAHAANDTADAADAAKRAKEEGGGDGLGKERKKVVHKKRRSALKS